MSEADRIKWDRKHAARETAPAVDDLVRRFAPSAPLGRALDLACGKGQNALYLAELGFEVDAVDISPVALAGIDHLEVRPICADLDDYAIQPQTYQLIVDTFFLDRRLFDGIRHGLVEDGLLIFRAWVRHPGLSRNPAYELEPGELRQAFGRWQVLHDQVSEGVASFAARKSFDQRQS